MDYGDYEDMTYHFPDAAFETGVQKLFAEKDIMYGFEPSDYHLHIDEARDSGTLFGSADAEYRFYALRMQAVAEVKAMRLEQTPRNTFAMLASMFLQEFAYDLEVSRWLAIANALIVGISEYVSRHGHYPVDTAAFVYAYMDNGEVALSHHY